MVDVQIEPVIRRVRTNGIELSVAEYGKSGPPLVLLHGIGSRYVSWWPVIGPLADHFHLIVPDLRGHGDSDKPTSGYLFTDYAADLAGLLDAYHIERPLLLGHSLGALVSMTWASRHPAQASEIVLEDPPTTSGRNDGAMLEGWLALALSTIDEVVVYYRERFPEWTEEERHRRAISITSTAPGVFQDLIDQSQSTGYPDFVGQSVDVTSPVLIIYGELDHGSSTDPAIVAEFVQTLPNAQSVQIPGGGHSLHRENTDTFLSAALPFLLGSGVP